MAARSGGSSSVSSLPPPCPKSPPEYPDLYGKRRETAKVQMLEREISFLEEELRSVDGLQPASKGCKEVTDYVMANSDPLIPTSRKKRKSCRFWKWLCGLPCFNLSWICCCCSSGCPCRLKCPWCCDFNLCNCSSCICSSCKCRSSNCCSAECSSRKCSCCDCSSCKCSSCDCTSCKCSSCDCSLCECSPCRCYSCNCTSCLSCCTIPKWRCCSCPKSNCCRKISRSRNCCIFQFPSCTDCCCCRLKCFRPKCPKIRLRCSCTKTCCNPCCLVL